MMIQKHNFPPLYDEYSQILILGSFPSVKSREQGFFYGHPQNRFWKVLSSLLEWEIPQTVEEKKTMLKANHIALWDVIASCDIEGSADSSIKNAVPNDLSPILQAGNIYQIFVNGNTAAKLYCKHMQPIYQTEAIVLPSTSPANAACNMEKLLAAWAVILPYLHK